MMSARTSGLGELRDELRASGFFEKPTTRILTELTIFLLIMLVGLVGYLVTESLLLKASAVMVFTLGSLGVTINTHTSSHYATSDRRWVNEFLTYFGYPFLVGFSATYWWHKHVVRHHPSPNVIGLDDDVDLQPLFAVNTAEMHARSALLRGYYRAQWLVVPIAIFLNSFNLELSGWRHLIGALRDPTRRRIMHWIDLAALCLQWLLWIVLPMFIWSPAHVCLFYLLRRGLISYAFFAVFVPAHFPPEAMFIDRESKDADLMLLQTSTTVNFRTGIIGRLLCAGVNYQIEHHLFPGMSHVHYAQASRIIEAYCRSHGYPYRTLGWGEAVVKSLLVFYRPKPVHTLVNASGATAVVK